MSYQVDLLTAHFLILNAEIIFRLVGGIIQRIIYGM